MQKYLEVNGALPELKAQELFRQIAQAMIVFNREDCVHRDLKPANILLSKDNQIKLADFGLARTFDESQEEKLLNTEVGTPYYKAPEIFKSMPYGANVDLWSLGIILFQMVAGRLPWRATSQFELW